MHVDFLLVRMGLLGAPVLALVIFIFLRKRRFPSRLVIVAASMLLLYLATFFVGLRFVSVRANLACTVAAYFAYSFLAVVCLRIQPSAIRLLAFVVAIIPIGLGYLLTTIRLGLIALVIVIGFYNVRPGHVEQMGPRLTCRSTEEHMGGSIYSIYSVGLYQSWSWVPLLERKVVGVLTTRNNADPELEPEDVSCANLMAKYEKPVASAAQSGGTRH
jgi:hypothetical protein